MEGNFARLAWQQMLEAVQTIHDERIVHGDLKPANFLFVRFTARMSLMRVVSMRRSRGWFYFRFRAGSDRVGAVVAWQRSMASMAWRGVAVAGPARRVPRFRRDPIGERSTLMPSYRAGPGPPEAY